MLKLGIDKIAKIMVGTQKFKYVYRGTDKVWSGASIVSYYDGNTLMGRNEIDEGQDVLHPSFNTQKTGYTLYGWATTSGATERVESLVATGEPMSLYAIYLPNTFTVYQAHINQYGQYVQDVVNSNYVSGAFAVSAAASWNQNEDSGSFTLLSKGKYNTATVTAYATFSNADSGGLNVGWATYDGAYILSDWNTAGASGSKSFVSNVGGHSIYVKAISYDAYWQYGDACITNIVLTNPIAWV